jgi:RND family efflux transporter MFP subunit
MPTAPKNPQSAIQKLRDLQRFPGEPSAFWPVFSRLVQTLSKARCFLVLELKNREWKIVAAVPEKELAETGIKKTELLETCTKLCATSIQNGQTSAKETVKGHSLLVSNMPVADADVRLGVFIDIPTTVEKESLTFFGLIADVPHAYESRRQMQSSGQNAKMLANALDILVLLNECDRFVAAVMTVCNEIASKFQTARTSIGWLKGRYVRVQGISHIDKFEPKMEAVQALETIMEEALDQDDEIMVPVEESTAIRTVSQAHESYCRQYSVDSIVSLPIRVQGEPVAVLTCERMGVAFSTSEIRGLRMICDQIGRRLADLKQTDRWFGARFTHWLRQKMSVVFGIEHTFAKLIGIVVALLLAYIIFGSWNYKIEAPCTLKTDTLAHLTAPYDGYIHEVLAKPGDLVEKGQPLMRLETRELLLEESAAVADLHRFSRSAEKARAQNALADMRIAEARVQQAKARLERVRFQLENADMTAPFSGIVVEGDRQDLLGAPVRRGDALMKIARLEDYYILLDVDETDIHHIAIGDPGSVAFRSRPETKFPIRVERASPMSEVKSGNNVFQVRSDIIAAPASWWRPGMSGIGKVEVGRKPIIWILGHRTVDFIHLHLWF